MPTLTEPAAPTRSRRRAPWAPVIAAFLTVAAVLFTLVGLSTRRLAQPALPDTFGWLDGWVRYDAGWYHTIATTGYYFKTAEQSPVAFFPAYPLGMRALGGLLGNVYLAGIVITSLSGLVVTLLFLRWCSDRLPRPVAIGALVLLLVYPYSLYLYGAVYADALFVASALGAFVLLERGHPWLAGLLGAVATASRPTGVAVLVGLTVRAVELAAVRRSGPTPAAAARPISTGKWRMPVRGVGLADVQTGLRVAAVNSRAALSAVRWRDTGVLLSAAGLVSYCGYLWIRFANPLAFVAAESAPGWDQGTGPRTWFKINFVGTMLLGRIPDRLRLIFPAIACLVVVLLLRRIQRRFGWGYAVYTAVVVAIPVLTTKDFMGSGRYLLAAFPAFAAGADFLAERPPWVGRLVVVGFAAGLMVAMVLYTRGFEVS